MKKRIRSNRNAYAINGTAATLTITSRSGDPFVFQIDTACLDRCQQYCYRVEGGVPVFHHPDTGRKIILARLLLNMAPEDLRHVKAINGDRSDLRLVNLRIGPRPITERPKREDRKRLNGTGFAGVSFHEFRKEKWRKFQAMTPGKRKGQGERRSLGYFASAEEASKAREDWIKQNNWTPKKPGRKVGWRKNKAQGK